MPTVKAGPSINGATAQTQLPFRPAPTPGTSHPLSGNGMVLNRKYEAESEKPFGRFTEADKPLMKPKFGFGTPVDGGRHVSSKRPFTSTCALAPLCSFGGMVSVRMRGGAEAARQLCSRTEIFILAESLGGVESLIEHPGAMTHASTAGSQLEVPDDLVRLSVGIEDIADLIADLRQALG